MPQDNPVRTIPKTVPETTPQRRLEPERICPDQKQKIVRRIKETPL